MKNVPNILSSFRIALVPAFIAVYFCGAENARWYAAGVYALAAITDILDGIIARKFNATSNLGRILDPLGDKLMTFSVLLCITIDKIIPLWAVTLFFLKELAMLSGGLIIGRIKKVDMPASNFMGKASTVVFFVVCVVLMLFDIEKQIADMMIAIAIVITFMALGGYVITFTSVMKNAAKQSAENTAKAE